MEGDWLHIILRIMVMLAAMAILAGSIVGWYFHQLHWSLRIFGILISFLIIHPWIQTTLLGTLFALVFSFFAFYRHKLNKLRTNLLII